MNYKYKIADFNCNKCERLKAFIDANREKYPDFFNGPVPSFGSDNPELLIVGLAPGLKGANQNGIPFTGDYAGDLLYPTLIKYGWAKGDYVIEKFNNGLTLDRARITNAVLCVPPQNKPINSEINTCREFLENELGNPSIKVILALGNIAHSSVVKAMGAKLSAYKFKHGEVHDFGNVKLVDSYHCSRYNLNTKRLTKDMFENVFSKISLNL
ncbi:MAG: uracil-DNA glycosylase [Alphaproteobacteria bacterium]|nr:uracil-DNA glycosylase [Alphaproteobacteria bacterium]